MTRRKRIVLGIAGAAALLVIVTVVCGTFAVVEEFRSGEPGPLDHDQVQELLPICGLTDLNDRSPTDAHGGGRQEEEFEFVYEDLPGSWVDQHILQRFGDNSTVDSLSPITPDQTRPGPATAWGNAELQNQHGSLVYLSPFSLSEMGTTLFDVYRSDGALYAVRATCRNEGGAFGALTAAAVTTSVP